MSVPWAFSDPWQEAPRSRLTDKTREKACVLLELSVSPPGHPHLGHLQLLYPVPYGLPDTTLGNRQALWLQDPVN